MLDFKLDAQWGDKTEIREYSISTWLNEIQLRHPEHFGTIESQWKQLIRVSDFLPV